MGTAASEQRGTLEMALAHARSLLGRDPALAEEQVQEILRAVPGYADALILQGRVFAARGRIEQAADALRRATQRNPASAEAWGLLGDQLVLLGDEDGADHAYSQQIRASVRDPELMKAAAALCDGDLPAAERLLKARLKLRPTDVAAIRMLAELAGRIGRYRDARVLLERAVQLAPSFAPAQFNLATVLYRQNQVPEALKVLEALMEADPENPAYRNLTAAALTRVGDVEEAVRHFEQVVKRSPRNSKVWLSYGHALKTVGRQADSINAYRHAIELQPGFGEPWWSLANLKTVDLGPDDIAAMETALDQPDLSVEDRFHLHFALGKALEDAERVEESFRHYAEGNRLRLAVVPYDPEETGARVDRSIALFTPVFFAARTGAGAAAADPIFILGMPRAGSTLIEQILASHPLVEGTQELPDIQMMAKRLTDDEEGYPQALVELDRDALRALGEEYLERTRIHRKTDRPFFIDKMPNNWAHLGFIHLILPNAKIVDARRHPLSCCFSNFKQHFARGQAFSYSLDHMGRYYGDYVRLMAHFDEVLPGRVHRVFYEAMVEDTEAQVRALLDYLGLEFDPACLRFYETERPVRTASSEQVRRPINRDGLAQWRPFEAWLGPLRDALGPQVAAYPHQEGDN